jgi:hypothetical protein
MSIGPRWLRAIRPKRATSDSQLSGGGRSDRGCGRVCNGPQSSDPDGLCDRQPGSVRGTAVTAVLAPCNLRCPPCILHGKPSGSRGRLGLPFVWTYIREGTSGNAADGMRCASGGRRVDGVRSADLDAWVFDRSNDGRGPPRRQDRAGGVVSPRRCWVTLFRIEVASGQAAPTSKSRARVPRLRASRERTRGQAGEPRGRAPDGLATTGRWLPVEPRRWPSRE